MMHIDPKKKKGISKELIIPFYDSLLIIKTKWWPIAYKIICDLGNHVPQPTGVVQTIGATFSSELDA